MRSPVPHDLTAVSALVMARDIADLGIADYTLDDLREEWEASDFDLTADARVVEADDEIVAYASVRHVGGSIAVSPDHEGRGIGTKLRHWVEARERELRRPLHIQPVAHADQRAAAQLRGAGYRHARSYSRMVRSLSDLAGDPPAPKRPPEAITITRLDRQADAVAVHGLDAAAFGSAPDYRPQTLASFREEYLSAHDFDVEASLVARDGGEIVGFLIAKRWESEGSGFVSILAVDPSRQGSGVGAALLNAAFTIWSTTGLREVQLGVSSDNRRARQLYERFGMTARFQIDMYERATELPVATSS